jgi:hypothetical protein
MHDYAPAFDALDPALEEAVHLFADGELPLGAHAALFARLADDAGARALLDGLLAFRRMSRLEPLAPPPALDASLLTRLRAAQVQRPKRDRNPHPGVWHRTVRMSVRAAAIGAGLLLFVGSLVPMRAPAPVPSVPAPLVVRPASGVAFSASYVIVDGVTVEADRD